MLGYELVTEWREGGVEYNSIELVEALLLMDDYILSFIGAASLQEALAANVQTLETAFSVVTR